MKTKLSNIKKHFVTHKTAYAVLGTATICLAINQRALREHDAFLEEKGLLQEYYAPEE